MKLKKYLLPEAEALRQFVESTGSVGAVATMSGFPPASVSRWISGQYPPNSSSRELIRLFLDDQGAEVGDRVVLNPAYTGEDVPAAADLDPDPPLENIDEQLVGELTEFDSTILRRDVESLCAALEHVANHSGLPAPLAAYCTALATDARGRLQAED